MMQKVVKMVGVIFAITGIGMIGVIISTSRADAGKINWDKKGGKPKIEKDLKQGKGCEQLPYWLTIGNDKNTTKTTPKCQK